MTINQRLRFELTDLAGLAIEREARESSVEVPFAAINPADRTIGLTRIPAECPRCGASWEGVGRGSPEATFLNDVALFLQQLGDSRRERRVRIRLDLPAPRERRLDR